MVVEIIVGLCMLLLSFEMCEKGNGLFYVFIIKVCVGYILFFCCFFFIVK